MDGIAGVINEAMGALRGSGLTYAALILSNGKTMFFALATSIISWRGIQMMFSDGDLTDSLGEFIEVLMLTSFTWLMLDRYEQFFLKRVIGGFDYVLDTFAGSDKAGVYSGFGKLTDAGAAVLASFEVPKEVAWWNAAGWVVSHAPAYLIKLATCGIINLAACIYVVMYALGEVLTAIALALGPILIPWLVFEKLDFLFWGWLKFLLGACFYKIVALLMVGLAAPAISIISEKVKIMYPPDAILKGAGADTTMSIIVMALAVLILLMMRQIPHIATGLLSGAANASASMLSLRRKAGEPKPNKK